MFSHVEVELCTVMCTCQGYCVCVRVCVCVRERERERVRERERERKGERERERERTREIQMAVGGIFSHELVFSWHFQRSFSKTSEAFNIRIGFCSYPVQLSHLVPPPASPPHWWENEGLEFWRPNSYLQSQMYIVLGLCCLLPSRLRFISLNLPSS